MLKSNERIEGKGKIEEKMKYTGIPRPPSGPAHLRAAEYTHKHTVKRSGGPPLKNEERKCLNFFFFFGFGLKMAKSRAEEGCRGEDGTCMLLL